jgi:hypothetical protein
MTRHNPTRDEINEEALSSMHRDHYEQLENAHDRAKDEQMEADWNEMQRPFLERLIELAPMMREFEREVDSHRTDYDQEPF